MLFIEHNVNNNSPSYYLIVVSYIFAIGTIIVLAFHQISIYSRIMIIILPIWFTEAGKYAQGYAYIVLVGFTHTKFPH